MSVPLDGTALRDGINNLRNQPSDLGLEVELENETAHRHDRRRPSRNVTVALIRLPHKG